MIGFKILKCFYKTLQMLLSVIIHNKKKKNLINILTALKLFYQILKKHKSNQYSIYMIVFAKYISNSLVFSNDSC